MATRETLVLLALKVAQVVLALVLTYSRCVGRLGPAGACTGPDEVTGIIVDVWARVDVSVGGEKDVAGGYEVGAEDIKVYYGWVKVRSLS